MSTPSYEVVTNERAAARLGHIVEGYVGLVLNENGAVVYTSRWCKQEQAAKGFADDIAGRLRKHYERSGERWEETKVKIAARREAKRIKTSKRQDLERSISFLERKQVETRKRLKALRDELKALTAK
jgi:hypothetical protein